MGINSEIYNLSGGTIHLGSLSGEKRSGHLVTSIAKSSYNYAAQGARDRDNNCFYDNYMRVYNTGAVIAAVRHTRKENTAAHAFNSINWNSKPLQASMTRMGVLSNKANNEFQQALAVSGTQSVQTQTNQVNTGRNNAPLNQGTNGLDKRQISQLGFTGNSLQKNDNLGVIGRNQIKNQSLNDTMTLQTGASNHGNTKGTMVVNNKQIRDLSIKAQNETARNASIMTAHGHLAKRANLIDIRDKQVTYLKSVSLTGHFDGSLKSARAEIDKNKQAISNLQNMLNQPGMAKDAKDKIKADIQKYQNNITDFKTYMDTGAKANIGCDKGKGYRAHGRQMVARNFLGNDMYRGVQFYKGLGKASVTGVRATIKSTAGVTATAVRGTLYAPMKIAKKAAPNSKFSKISESIYNGTGNAKHAVYDRVDRHKMSREAKKSEQRNKRLERRERTNARIAKHGDKLNAKLANAKSMKLQGVNTDKKIAKLEKRQANLTRLTGMRNRRLARHDNIRIVNARIRGIINTPRRAVNGIKSAPRRFASWATRKPRMAIKAGAKRIKEAIKDAFTKKLIPLIGAGLGALIATLLPIIVQLIPIMLLVAFFGSDNPASELAEELKNVNYIQLIVNETSNTLGRQFTNTAIKQAESYYLSEGHTVASSKYDWTRSVENGTIQSIWASEDMKSEPYLNYKNDQLKGVSANLVPIVSMMHYRFEDDINFENYYTAKGYVFFMYVRSHDVAYLNDEDESNDDYAYTYDSITDCSDEDVFTSMNYNEDTHEVTRGDTECNNVYIHGYTSEYNKSINSLRGKLSSWLSKTNTSLKLPGSGEANGVFIGHSAPSDSKGTCDNYNTYRGDLECTKEVHNHEASDEYYDYTCGQEEHTHSNDCREWIVDITSVWDGTYNDSTHAEVDNADYNYDDRDEDDFDERESCYEWQDEMGYNIYYECGQIRRVSVADYDDDPEAYAECPLADYDWHTEDHNDHSIKDMDEYTIEKKANKVQICNGHHEHDEDCKNYVGEDNSHWSELECGKEEHSHEESGCHEGWIKPDGTECTKEEHAHDPWVSETDYGCYYTAYVCKGHCGGHIRPALNIVQDMELATLMEKDCFKITFFLAESDFVHQSTEGQKTIDAWKDKWLGYQKVWFYPIPSSPKTALQWGAHKTIEVFAKFGSWISGNGWTLSTKQFSTNDENTDDPDDLFQFKGWGKCDSSSNYKLYEDTLSDMHDLYGDWKSGPDWDEKYQQAIEIFESFDVSFPAGYNMVPSDDMKNSIIESIKKNNPNISEQRLKLLTNENETGAIDLLGKFYYSATGSGNLTANTEVNAHYIGAYTNKGGPSNNDSFVLGRIRNNIDGSYPYKYNKGTDIWNSGNFLHRQKKAGDILVNEEGNMAIYVGYLDKIDGYVVGTSTNTTPSKWKEEGAGEYIIECSEEYGGSVLRKVDSSELQGFRIVNINGY